MKQETVDKLFTKVVDMNKSARMLAGLTALRKQAAVIAKKQAVYDIANGVMCKKADAVSDMIGGGNLPGMVGRAIGMFDEPADEKERADMDRSALRGVLIPGVGGYRNERRMKGILKDDKGGTPHYWSQMFGGITSTLALAALLGSLGAGGAYAYSKYKKLPNGGKETKPLLDYNGKPMIDPWTKEPMMDTRYFNTHLDRAGMGGLAGAGAGAGLGLLASLVGGPLGAAFTKRRTKEEQQAHNNTSTWKDWLLPGVADYNQWKAVGRNVGDSEERVADKKDDKKEDKKEEKS